MKGKKTRGSSKLASMSPDELQNAIGLARESFTIERWWKYGQPAVDNVSAVINVGEVSNVGAVAQGIIGLHNSQLQVGIVIFPYGIPSVLGARLEVTMQESQG